MEGPFADDRTSVLPPSNCSVCGTWREACGGLAVGSVGVMRSLCCHLRAGFQQCKSFVEMGTVRCCPLSGAEDCITSARRLWRAPLVSSPRSRPTRCRASPAPLSAQTVRVVCWTDILLDVIGGVEKAPREGCPRTMTGVSQYWFSGHF